MFSLPLGAFLLWARSVTLYFLLFWAYLPFAWVAKELATVEARYR